MADFIFRHADTHTKKKFFGLFPISRAYFILTHSHLKMHTTIKDDTKNINLDCRFDSFLSYVMNMVIWI